MNNTELKLCPFCGGKAYIDKVTNDYPNYVVRYSDCRCSTRWAQYSDVAMKIWNRRADK